MALTTTEEALVRQLLDQQAAILSLAGNESTITSKLGATKVTLADLVAASSVADADMLLTRQGTTDKSVRADILAAYMGAELGALFAPIASPALTGTPTAPTAAAGTNTTQIATTAFVAAATWGVTIPASTTVRGMVRLATSAEAQWLSDATIALTPATLDAALRGSNQSLAGNGYQKLPGGLIIQWGLTGSAGTVRDVSAAFPIAFPNACFQATMSTTTLSAYASLVTPSKTTITARIDGGGSGVAVSGRYIAIGY